MPPPTPPYFLLLFLSLFFLPSLKSPPAATQNPEPADRIRKSAALKGEEIIPGAKAFNKAIVKFFFFFHPPTNEQLASLLNWLKWRRMNRSGGDTEQLGILAFQGD